MASSINTSYNNNNNNSLFFFIPHQNENASSRWINCKIIEIGGLLTASTEVEATVEPTTKKTKTKWQSRSKTVYLQFKWWWPPLYVVRVSHRFVAIWVIKTRRINIQTAHYTSIQLNEHIVWTFEMVTYLSNSILYFLSKISIWECENGV